MHKSPTILSILLYFVAITSHFSYAEIRTYTKEELIQDARQLLNTIEQSHPDPYINGGGKIAFHRRFHQLISTIPEQGMTKDEFYLRLLPFVAALGDSHTAVLHQPANQVQARPISLGLKIIEDSYCVSKVPGIDLKHLVGAKVKSICGVDISTLRKRVSRIRGIENRYGRLAFVKRFLSSGQSIDLLLPEFNRNHSYDWKLELPSGMLITHRDKGTEPNTTRPYSPKTTISLKNRQKGVFYAFLKPDTAYLSIPDMMRYREACEGWLNRGFSEAMSFTKQAYKFFKGDPVPDIQEQLLQGIPSISETMVGLILKAKKLKTRYLIVDLRDNTGGNSVMVNFVNYFLSGYEEAITFKADVTIIKHSDLLFTTYKNLDLKKINLNTDVKITGTDYDFRDEREESGKKDMEHLKKEFRERYQGIKSFWKVFKTGKFHTPQHRFEKIFVLSTPFTFSSGFNLLSHLYKKGAVLVGTPSAQPGNNFGDSLPFKLNNTGLQCYVSHKRIITFPDDKEKGHLLVPHYGLAYEKFKAYNFDPNSEILYTLELIDKARD